MWITGWFMFAMLCFINSAMYVAIGLAFDEGWFDPNEETPYKGIGNV